jgi:DNA invertase Pin-like site-specific DNA recombinase
LASHSPVGGDGASVTRTDTGSPPGAARHAGLARARIEGVRLGRPPVVERLAERKIIAARAAAPQKSTRAIARELGVSERHVRRVLAQERERETSS